MRNKGKGKLYLAISVFSILFFVCFYGVHALNPGNTDWLLAGGLDISQNYLGWHFFRKGPWMFPVGNFTSLSYPNELSIIYMDSIPLLAVIFKVFRPILPEHFQYFGWYHLLCFVLQGVLGVKIASKYSRSDMAAFLVGVLTVMTPAFLWRTFLHVALGSHWIVLLALLSIFYYEESFAGRARRSVIYWGLLGFFCTTLHLYFLPMCFIILCGFLYLDIRSRRPAGGIGPGDRGRMWAGRGLTLLGFWAGVLVPMYILGGFIQGVRVSNLDYTWKKTFNLNGFFNPQGWSRVLPNLSLHTYGQSEGFAYLGMGVFACIFLAALICVPGYLGKGGAGRVCDALKRPKVQTLMGIAVLSVAAAVSPVVTLGSRAVTIPFPKKLEEIWIIFRSCGRFVWPAIYVITFAACYVLLRSERKKRAIAMLFFCVIVQGIDISAEAWDRGRVSREPQAFVSELQDAGWRVIGEHPDIQNIVYINRSGLQSCASIGEFADRYDMTLGKFYYSRDFEEPVKKSAEQALADKRKEDIFLFDTERMIDAWNEPELHYYILDENLLGYREPIAGLEQKEIDVRAYEYVYVCEVPEGSVNAEMIDEFLFLHGGGAVQFAGFVLPAGAYRFTVEGENLSDAKIVLSEGNVDIHEMQTVSGMIVYDDSGEWKVRIENPSDHDMVLYQIRLQPIDG